MEKKRVATQEEKRHLFDTEVLTDYIEKGENALGLLLEKPVLIDISADDRQALLDRMMRTPYHKAIFFMLNDIVTSDGIKTLSEDQEELAKQKKPKIRVTFTHFLPPAKIDGGWQRAKPDHERIRKWSLVYKQYEDYIIQSSRNANNMREAIQNELPIDMVVTTTTTTRKKKNVNILLRVVIFEPLPENQRGPDIFIEPVVTSTTK